MRPYESILVGILFFRVDRRNADQRKFICVDLRENFSLLCLRTLKNYTLVMIANVGIT